MDTDYRQLIVIGALTAIIGLLMYAAFQASFKWAFLPVIVVFSLGGWLLATRPDVTVQLRGEDAKAYIEEQQGIVTNFSILNIILFIKYFWIDAVIERRIHRPQGLITKGR